MLKNSSLKISLKLALSLWIGLSFLATVACDKKPYTSISAHTREGGTTGFPSPNGSNYSTGKDEKRLQELTEELAPRDPLAPTDEEILRMTLAQSLSGGRVLRFNSLNQAARFGNRTITVILKTTDENLRSVEHVFKAELKWLSGRYEFNDAVSDKDSSYTLSGHFVDHPESSSSEGKLIVKQQHATSLSIEAHILYRAYLADLNLRTRVDQRNNSSLQKDLSDLKSYKQAWVNNFVVTLGRAFYDYVLIRTQESSFNPEANISFSGETIRTTEEHTTAATVTSSKKPIQIRLVGDAEDEDQRTFEVTIETEEGPEMVMVDIDSSSESSMPRIEDTPEREEYTPPSAPETEDESERTIEERNGDERNNGTVNESETESEQVTQRETEKEREQVQVQESVSQSEHKSTNSRTVSLPVDLPADLQEQRRNTPATVFENPAPPQTQNILKEASVFLYDLESTPALQKVHQDIQKNIQAPEVQAWIKTILGQSDAPAYKNGNKDNTNYHRRFLNFLKGASPFRTLISTIFNHYELPAAMTYLTINESEFFIDSRYPIQNNSSSTAYGPFQFLKGTASSRNVNMKVDESQQVGQMPASWDERGYFAPSACGAASYFSYLTRLFENGDRTLAILAYGIGEGAAAAAITCDSGNDQQSLSQCENRGLYKFSSSDYNKFIQNLSAYNYTFAEVSRRNFVPENFVRYTRKWLAYYAVGQNLSSYGINLPETSSSLPEGKVLPSGGVNSLHNPSCREALAGFKF